ncbi:hypothetical protein CCUS01_11154 [Colletotrichum cuscutae]|uniref:Uncharacterized protein n=1 Tax=Colletotrichum cuscutae TaxID=1209917 RepID=A0AAI9XIB0_9PEZI|nr:hypothetical protein CCUS01_11154 [Colletotrichum cuscutae]
MASRTNTIREDSSAKQQLWRAVICDRAGNRMQCTRVDLGWVREDGRNARFSQVKVCSKAALNSPSIGHDKKKPGVCTGKERCFFGFGFVGDRYGRKRYKAASGREGSFVEDMNSIQGTIAAEPRGNQLLLLRLVIRGLSGFLLPWFVARSNPAAATTQKEEAAVYPYGKSQGLGILKVGAAAAGDWSWNVSNWEYYDGLHLFFLREKTVDAKMMQIKRLSGHRARQGSLLGGGGGGGGGGGRKNEKKKKKKKKGKDGREEAGGGDGERIVQEGLGLDGSADIQCRVTVGKVARVDWYGSERDDEIFKVQGRKSEREREVQGRIEQSGNGNTTDGGGDVDAEMQQVPSRVTSSDGNQVLATGVPYVVVAGKVSAMYCTSLVLALVFFDKSLALYACLSDLIGRGRRRRGISR